MRNTSLGSRRRYCSIASSAFWSEFGFFNSAVATGSPFGPVERDGTTYRIGQANNALMFPGLGLGVIVCRAATMPPSLFIAAARALAKLADPTDPAKGLLPDISRLREVSATVAVDVVNTATAAGIATVQVADPIEAVHEAMWTPDYLPITR